MTVSCCLYIISSQIKYLLLLDSLKIIKSVDIMQHNIFLIVHTISHELIINWVNDIYLANCSTMIGLGLHLNECIDDI